MFCVSCDNDFSSVCKDCVNYHNVLLYINTTCVKYYLLSNVMPIVVAVPTGPGSANLALNSKIAPKLAGPKVSII